MVTLFRRGSVYWVQFRKNGQRVRESLRTENKKLAEELRRRRSAELEAERFGLVRASPVAGVVRPEPLPEPEPPPVASVESIRADYAAWSSAHKRPKTILNDSARLATFFATVTGKPLGQISTADVERFLTREAMKGRQPATLLRHREILHAFWRWAVRQGHVVTNVVSPIPRPRLPERDPRFLSLDQIDELLRAVAGDHVEGLVATAVFAGLRREELCWLTWDDLELDLEPGILRVRAKTVAGESWQPKTKRDRKVPVNLRLRAALVAHRAKAKRAGVPWMFPSPEGKRWDPDNVSRHLRAVLARSGLPWNLLELRHTFGSQLARKGVSLLKIAKLMGNSPAIASKHYINLVPEEMGSDVEF